MENFRSITCLTSQSNIDAMTADKSLKFRKYELETEEWAIAEDLVTILLEFKNVTLFFP